MQMHVIITNNVSTVNLSTVVANEMYFLQETPSKGKFPGMFSSYYNFVMFSSHSYFVLFLKIFSWTFYCV